VFDDGTTQVGLVLRKHIREVRVHPQGVRRICQGVLQGITPPGTDLRNFYSNLLCRGVVDGHVAPASDRLNEVARGLLDQREHIGFVTVLREPFAESFVVRNARDLGCPTLAKRMLKDTPLIGHPAALLLATTGNSTSVRRRARTADRCSTRRPSAVQNDLMSAAANEGLHQFNAAVASHDDLVRQWRAARREFWRLYGPALGLHALPVATWIAVSGRGIVRIAVVLLVFTVVFAVWGTAAARSASVVLIAVGAIGLLSSIVNVLALYDDLGPVVLLAAVVVIPCDIFSMNYAWRARPLARTYRQAGRHLRDADRAIRRYRREQRIRAGAGW